MKHALEWIGNRADHMEERITKQAWGFKYRSDSGGRGKRTKIFKKWTL